MKRIIPAVLTVGLMALTPYLIAQVETPTEPASTASPEPTKETTPAPMKESSPEATPEETKTPAKPKAAPAASAAMFMPRNLKWEDNAEGIPGAKIARLEGDPRRRGPYTVRLEVGNGFQLQPHSHPATEHITVISGALYLAMGDKFDEKAAQKFPAGSYLVIPARAKHFSFAKGKTVVQLHGTGPTEINFVSSADEPKRMDAQKKETKNR
jgi:quercetin dioxygenase-like cupin family protein